MSVRKLFLVLSVFYSAISVSQVGVGTVMPNSSTMLDVEATNKGVLLPRVELSSSTDATTIVPQNEVGLLVFNTKATADIEVGYHFWDGTKWVAMFSEGLLSGAGDPNTNGTTGGAGDLYVDESTGDVYVHDGNTWVTSDVSETTTTLVDNGNGTFTYTSEDGTTATFDVTQSDTGNPNTNGTTGGAGDVYVDESNGDVYVHDGNTWITSDVSETTTTLVDNGNGTFTYTSEDGTTATFDVTQSDTGDPNTNGTTAGAGDVYVDESTGDVWTFNGTTWVQQNIPISASNGLTFQNNEVLLGGVNTTHRN